MKTFKLTSVLPFTLVSTLLFWGCEGSTQKSKTLNDCDVIASVETIGTDKVTVCDLNLVKDTISLPLSELVEDFEIVKLDDREEALIKDAYSPVFDNYIGSYGWQMPYKLFDRKGKYLCTVGSYGQGASEYTSLYDSQVDEKNNCIYLFPWQNARLLVYDLQGKPLPDIPLAYRAPKARFHVDPEKKTVTVALLPFQGIKSVIWVQDFEGKVIQEVDATPYQVGNDFSNEITVSRNTNEFDYYLFNWSPRNDSLYHYNIAENRLAPVFTVKFKTSEIPIHDFAELPLHYLANITPGVEQVGEGSFVSLPPVQILVDKKTLKGSYIKLVNDFLGNIPAWTNFTDGYFVANMDPANLKEALAKVLASPSKLSDEMKKKVTDLHNSITDNDNNYIFTAKLKK